MTSEELDDLEYEVLWSAAEDVTGVHELLWTANGWWPDKPDDERRRMARDALVWALGSGFVELLAGSSPDATAAVDRGRWGDVLAEEVVWTVPDGPRLFFWRTEAGAEELRDRPVPDTWHERTWGNKPRWKPTVDG
jgi:hypothetical protein